MKKNVFITILFLLASNIVLASGPNTPIDLNVNHIWKVRDRNAVDPVFEHAYRTPGTKKSSVSNYSFFKSSLPEEIRNKIWEFLLNGKCHGEVTKAKNNFELIPMDGLNIRARVGIISEDLESENLNGTILQLNPSYSKDFNIIFGMLGQTFSIQKKNDVIDRIQYRILSFDQNETKMYNLVFIECGKNIVGISGHPRFVPQK